MIDADGVCSFCRSVVGLGSEHRRHDEAHSRSCAQLQIARALDTSNALLREILETLKHGSSEARQSGGFELRPGDGFYGIRTQPGDYVYPGDSFPADPGSAPADARPAEPAAAGDVASEHGPLCRCANCSAITATFARFKS